MEFILGIIAGLVIAAFIAAVLAYFKKPIQRALEVTEQVLESVGPRSKGYIFEAEDESDVVRQEIVARNAEKGRDTPISELM